VQFAGGQAGPFLFEQLVSYSDDGAQRAYNAAKELFASCTAWDAVEDDGTTTSYTTSALSFPQIGDETLALRLSGDADVASVVLDIVIVRQGDIICIVAGAGSTSILGVTSVEPADLEATARAAVAKVADL
jgi:hypothetical protein